MTESEFWQQNGQYKRVSRKKGEDVFSQCGDYRYLLRRGDLSGKKKVVCFICFNPAKRHANPEKDCTDGHPTVKRCKELVKSWKGYAGFIIVNLFAYRDKNLKNIGVIEEELDSVSSRNRKFIRWAIQTAKRSDGVVIAAWGAKGEEAGRADKVEEIAKDCEVDLHCLGFPWHPARSPKGCKPLFLRTPMG